MDGLRVVDGEDDGRVVVAVVVVEEGEGDILAVMGEGRVGRVGYVMSEERVDSAVVVEEEVIEVRGFRRRYSVSHSFAAMMAGCEDSDVGRLCCG